VANKLTSSPVAKLADPLRIPNAMRSTVDPLLEEDRRVCAAQLDNEYARLSRKMAEAGIELLPVAGRGARFQPHDVQSRAAS